MEYKNEESHHTAEILEFHVQYYPVIGILNIHT